MISELTTAFKMGIVFIPMVLIDLLVAGVLMSLGDDGSPDDGNPP